MNKIDLLRAMKDPKFYLESFCKVKLKEGGFAPFILKEHQKDLFNALKTNKKIIILKARQLGFCLDPDTNVLMADLTWRKLRHVKVGDEIIASDEEVYGGRGSARKMRTAIIENKFNITSTAIKVTLDDGRELIMTPEHKMLCKYRGAVHTIWRNAETMRIGDEIRAITNHWIPEMSYDDGWISGIIDGEGSLRTKKNAGTELSISQVDGPVWDKIVQYFIDRNYSYRIEVDKRKAGDSSKLGSKPVNKLVLNRMNELFELLGKVRPMRFVNRRWWEEKKMPNYGWHKIVKIEKIPEQKMIDLQTSEKTFIANGFVSHNSTAMAAYFYYQTIMNPGITTALIGYNSELVSELLDKIKTFIKSTPPQLRPKIQYNSKYEISFPNMESKIMILPSTENVGSGYTFNYCLAKDTKIICENGITKKIDDLRSGDVITNGNGGYSKVVELLKKKTDKKMLSVSANGMEDDITLTNDHLMLSRDKDTRKIEWRESERINMGDYIAFPYFQVRERYTTLEIEQSVREIYKNKYLKNKIDIDYNFGLLVGWYLAEGTTEKYRILFSLDKDEVKDFLKIANNFSEYVGYIKVKKNNDSRTRVVEMYGANFARFIEKYCGRSECKKINDCIWYWGKEFADGLLFGLFSGDGCFKNNRKVVLTNTNEGIINQTKKLLVSRRIGLANIHRNDNCYRYDVKSKTRYDLVLNGTGNYKFRRMFNLELPVYDNNRAKWRTKNAPTTNQGNNRWRRGKFHYWAKVKSVKESDYDDYVYDIVLKDNPHSFLTTSGVVHNCLVTELPKWEKIEEKMTSLLPATKEGVLVVESSPKGAGDYFHRMVVKAERGESEFLLKRYGWWCGYSKEEIDGLRKEHGEMYVAQEYEMAFLSSGRPVFDQKMVLKLYKGVLTDGEMNGEHKVYSEDGWRVYDEPKQDGMYIVGGDVSEGILGGDYSVATIWDRKTGEEVAMYRGLIAPDKFGDLLNSWGRKYNNALMVVEVNNHGLTTLTILKQKLYPSPYFRQGKIETIGAVTTDRMGWKTTTVTRPLLIDEFNKALRDGDLKPHSKELMDEMTVFVYDDNNRMTAQSGFHDDVIFSAGIGYQGYKVLWSGKLDQIDYNKYIPSNYSY